jgi:galactitol-specific phosphotransferase system IIB component
MKLGLAIGTSVVASEKLSAKVLNDKSEFKLSKEQQKLMQQYEKWMDEFIPAIQAQRKNQEDVLAKQSIVELSQQAEEWREQLAEYMKDENFARYYMTVTEKMTKEIY